MERQKVILYKSQLLTNEDVTIRFSLTSDEKLSGTFTLFDDDEDDINNDDLTVVSGNTRSRLDDLLKYIKDNPLKVQIVLLRLVGDEQRKVKVVETKQLIVLEGVIYIKNKYRQ